MYDEARLYTVLISTYTAFLSGSGNTDKPSKPSGSSSLDIPEYIVTTSCCPCLAGSSCEYEEDVEANADWRCPRLQPLVICIVVELFREPEKQIVRVEVDLQALRERCSAYKTRHVLVVSVVRSLRVVVDGCHGTRRRARHPQLNLRMSRGSELKLVAMQSIYYLLGSIRRANSEADSCGVRGVF